MWCQHCGQDVPAVKAAADGPPHCSRCQQPFARPANDQQPASPATATQHDEDDPSRQDRRLRQIGRTLRTPLPVASITAEGNWHWVDAPPSAAVQETPRGAPSKAAVRSEMRMQLFAWLALAVGLGLAAGGVGLVGLGMFGEQPVFWQWGVGVTLAGQAILIAALVRVLTSLWNSSRAAQQRLKELQHELAEVGRTAEAIIAQRPGGASGFYGELARGASPAVLLANLKGQIDHLAARLHR